MSTMPTARILDAVQGWVRYEPFPPPRKVAIIGHGPSRDTAPWADPAWIVWGLNEIPQPRATAWFELHPMDKQNDRELAWLSAQSAPVYVLEPTPLVPQGVCYPLERVLATTRGRLYFTCTFAYQIALAIADGFTEIGLWGVDLDYGTLRERTVEKACVEYWLGVAEGRGMRVTIAHGSPMLYRPHLYGYDYDAELREVEAYCEDLAGALPKGAWPATVVERLEARVDAFLARRAALDDEP